MHKAEALNRRVSMHKAKAFDRRDRREKTEIAEKDHSEWRSLEGNEN
jgi:hypothetical protein